MAVVKEVRRAWDTYIVSVLSQCMPPPQRSLEYSLGLTLNSNPWVLWGYIFVDSLNFIHSYIYTYTYTYTYTHTYTHTTQHPARNHHTHQTSRAHGVLSEHTP